MKKIVVIILCIFLVGCSKSISDAPASQHGNGFSILNSTTQSFNLTEVNVYVDDYQTTGGGSMIADGSSYEQGDIVYFDPSVYSIIHPNSKVELEVTLYQVQPIKKFLSKTYSSSNPRVQVANAKVDITGVQQWVELELVKSDSLVITNKK